jgi:hypothetical protein
MKHRHIGALAVIWGVLTAIPAGALEKPGVTYPVFQFPADRIPRVDGNADDWSMVPDSYIIGTDQLTDDTKKYPHPDKKTLDVKVRVGWVKGLNRLYFLYEAQDDYWDFSLPGLHNDTFEVVVDGDASGGPLIDKGHKELWTPEEVGTPAATPDERISTAEAHWAVHGVHAQNYHIFTPALNKDWALAWGAPSWIKELPWANAAYSYNFKPGGHGKLTLEFWITPFDYAGPEGPQRAVESVLRENKIIGLSWAIIDYDDVNATTYNGFWNLSPQHTMYGNASQLCAFRLMPLENQLRKPIEAQWSYEVIDMDRRLVAFEDLSTGQIDSWHWDFGDNSSSDERFPQHHYEKPGNYVVILDVRGPAGTSRRSKVWDVQLR